MSVLVHAEPRPKKPTELATQHLRAQVTYTPGTKLSDYNTLRLRPIFAYDEPTYRDYLGKIDGTIEGHRVADSAWVAVTAKRVIVCAYESFKPIGEIVITSIDRDDLQPVTAIPPRKRNEPPAALVIAPGVELRIALPRDRTALLVAALQPEASASMGAEAHARREAKKAEAEQQRLDQINAHAAEARREKEVKEARSANRPDLSLGLLDHRKTWQYSVASPTDQCVHAFVAAFSTRAGLVMNGRWEVETDPEGATAVYIGRRGFVGLLTSISERAQAEKDSAVGTQVRFIVGESPAGKALCTLRLIGRGVGFGLTSDARFIRPHFHAVTKHLQQLDPNLEVRSS